MGTLDTLTSKDRLAALQAAVGTQEWAPRVLDEHYLQHFLEDHGDHHCAQCAEGHCEDHGVYHASDAFDFNGIVSSYAGAQDRAGAAGAAVGDDGSSLALTGNTWKKAELPGGITIGTGDVLKVTLEIPKGGVGEIHAIGFDNDSTWSGSDRPLFQLAGTDRLGSADQSYAGQAGSGKTVSYEIDLSDYAGQSFDYLTFINDADGGQASKTIWSNVILVKAGVEPDTPTPSLSERFDFTGAVSGYAGGQDRAGSAGATVTDGGDALSLSGNTWKKAEIPGGLTISDGDILRVTLEIPTGGLGEIHAIGFDNDSTWKSGQAPMFQLAGTQRLGSFDQSHSGQAAPGKTVSYEIDLSDYAGRSFDYLTFVNDADAGQPMRSIWSGISIGRPADTDNRAPTTAPIDAGSVSESAAPVAIDLLANARDADGDRLSVDDVVVTDESGQALDFSLSGGRLTIDPEQLAKRLMSGDTETISIDYDVIDGRGGVAEGSASLDVQGAGDSFVSGRDGGYNVEVVFAGTWTSSLREAFIDAAETISSMITRDVVDVTHGGERFDDLRIDATLADIDGVGGTLGSAGPTLVRLPTYQPIKGAMRFDTADAANLEKQGIWEDVIFHEMMHALGFGTIWNALKLITDVNGDLRFNGENAIAAYEDLFPSIAGRDSLSDVGVPVETDGGPGTAGGHWDEATFGDEVMTGYVGRSNTLSDMTLAALEDMGYETVWDSPIG